MLRRIRFLLFAGISAFALATLTGCEVDVDEGPLEDAVEELDDAADE